MAKELRKRAETELEAHVTTDEYIRFYGKVYVPTSQVNRIIRQTHAAVIHEH